MSVRARKHRVGGSMVLDILQSIAALLVTLAVLIAVHEYGAFKLPKWCGVHVERFSIGFSNIFAERARHRVPTDQCQRLFPSAAYQ